MAKTEIAGGYGDGSFRPNRDVNRGQFAAFLDRYNKKCGTSDSSIVVSAPRHPFRGLAAIHPRFPSPPICWILNFADAVTSPA